VIKVKDEFVAISVEEYEQLKRDSEFLGCLEACGVDNWNGYEDAWDMFERSDEE
jgi:hypothetical protein